MGERSAQDTPRALDSSHRLEADRKRAHVINSSMPSIVLTESPLRPSACARMEDKKKLFIVIFFDFFTLISASSASRTSQLKHARVSIALTRSNA